MEKRKFITELLSKYDFGKTVELLISEAERRNWKIPAVHDLQQTLAKSGINVKPVKVLEICKPQYSAKILELNDERIISVMMPCRISIYQKDDGGTYMAIINGDELTADQPGKVVSAMKAASDEISEIVSTVSQ